MNTMTNPLQSFRERFGNLVSFSVNHPVAKELEQFLLSYGDERYEEGKKDALEGKTVAEAIYQDIRFQAFQELEKEIEEVRKRFRCGACGGAKLSHTLGCQALSILAESLKKKV